MKDFFIRWKYRFLAVMGYADCLKRRVQIENALWRMSAGQEPLPDRDKCREMAQTLGIPTKDRK